MVPTPALPPPLPDAGPVWHAVPRARLGLPAPRRLYQHREAQQAGGAVQRAQGCGRGRCLAGWEVRSGVAHMATAEAPAHGATHAPAHSLTCHAQSSRTRPAPAQAPSLCFCCRPRRAAVGSTSWGPTGARPQPPPWHYPLAGCLACVQHPAVVAAGQLFRQVSTPLPPPLPRLILYDCDWTPANDKQAAGRVRTEQGRALASTHRAASSHPARLPADALHARAII